MNVQNESKYNHIEVIPIFVKSMESRTIQYLYIFIKNTHDKYFIRHLLYNLGYINMLSRNINHEQLSKLHTEKRIEETNLSVQFTVVM